MGRFKPTTEQGYALEAKGTVLVSAAAGSGKTAVLANRVVRKIADKDDPADLNDMLIVTFTNAAAQEMRERIALLLGEAVKEDPTNLRLLRQKLSVENAPIGTIDSFCINLLRENFVAAGVDPDFRIVTGEQLDVMKNDAVVSAYSRLASDDFSAYSALLTAMGCENVDKNAKDTVTKINDYICSLPMPDKWLDNACAMYENCSSVNDCVWLRPMCDNIIEACEHFAGVFDGLREKLTDDDSVSLNYAPSIEYIADVYIPRLLSAARKYDYSDVREAVSAYNKPNAGSRKHGDQELKAQITGAIDGLKSYRNKAAEMFSEPAEVVMSDIRSSAYLMKILIGLVRDYREILSGYKAEKHLLSFADVELAVLRLLCEEKDGKLVARDTGNSICRRFSEVMVDEFQDTNDLQNTIFNALSGNGERLFLVGDVKQSIYRFRHANPNNFLSMRRSFRDYDPDHRERLFPSKIALSGNFRSRPQICAFANFCFDLLMTADAAQIDYLKSDWLDPKLEDLPENGESGVEIRLLDNTDKDKEFDYIASYIAKCVDGGMQIADGGRLRPARYGDFVVLLRGFKNNGARVVSALKKHGIPVSAEISANFFDRIEIILIMSLLRAIDNPLRDIPLLSAMMSPVFGFTADEIGRMRAGDRNRSLYSSLRDHAKDNAHAAAFLERLSTYRSWAASLPIDRLISRIYDDTGMLAVALAMEDGASCRGNMLLLAQYASSYEASGYKGLTSFLRYTERIRESADSMSAASVSDAEDTVRVMTIHKSKGLQAPVCIYAATEDKFSAGAQTDNYVMHEQYGIGLKLCDVKEAARFDTFAYNAINRLSKEADIAEQMRLMYVAMTRAQEKLIIISAEKDLSRALSSAAVKCASLTADEPFDPFSVKSAGSAAEWFYMCLMTHPDGNSLRKLAGYGGLVRNTGSHISVCVVDPEIEKPESGEQQAEQTEIDLCELLDYRYPYEELLNIESKYSVSTLAKSISPDACSCTARPAFVTGDTMTAAERGTATHRFMCYANYEAASEDIESEARRLAECGKLTPEQAQGINREAIRSFFESEIYELIGRADRVLRESRFIFEIPASEVDPGCGTDEPVVLQGVADCIIFEADGITVVDFKTDRNTTEEALRSKYTEQLRYYAKAFSTNYSLPVKRCLLYSFFLEKVVETPCF